jgi:LPPG:FO 2-phospho-L-lactate transferase
VTPQVAVLAGGVGAAKFLRGLITVVPQSQVTAIVNVGDDTVLHGLMVSPDIDTITYTLAESVNPATGWGLIGETWQAIEQVRRYAQSNHIFQTDAIGNDAAGWFALGDRDLGTHLYRTSRRNAGATLTQVTAEICRTWGLELNLLPVTNDALRTEVRTADGRELSFQEYFVREHHSVAVSQIRFTGAEIAVPGPEVLASIEQADVVCIAPSNPVVSIDPVLAVPEVRAAVTAVRERTIAISPIVGGAALKGPADRLLRELGHEVSVVGIARYYAEFASTLVIDSVDEQFAEQVEAAGMRCVVTPTVMTDREAAAELAQRCIDAIIAR